MFPCYRQTFSAYSFPFRLPGCLLCFKDFQLAPLFLLTSKKPLLVSPTPLLLPQVPLLVPSIPYDRVSEAPRRASETLVSAKKALSCALGVYACAYGAGGAGGVLLRPGNCVFMSSYAALAPTTSFFAFR